VYCGVPHHNAPLAGRQNSQSSAAPATSMTQVTREVFGATAQGEEVGRYILSHGQLEVEVISWGATLAAVRLAGVDLVLGFDDMAGYTSAPGHGKNPYMGAVVGRVANRCSTYM